VSAEEPKMPGGPGGPSSEPTEEELRAAYEAELSRMTSADLIAQAIVSLLNLGARRLGPIGGPTSTAADAQEDPEAESARAAAAAERDLEQVRDAIDAVRALLEILERSVPEGVRPLRDALSQVQMAYAREVQSAASASTAAEPAAGQVASTPARGTGEVADAAKDAGQQPQEHPDEPGPAQTSGRLWVPGS
jgi:hypothetical protein